MYSLTALQFNKKAFIILCAFCAALLLGGNAFASMPALVAGEYGTDTDNENNAHTGTPDGDMDALVGSEMAKHPIEFNIIIPNVDPSNRGATLRMDVYDVDSDWPGSEGPETDTVYVNGVYVGTLNGRSDTWGVNIFDIPIGTLKTGKNLVEIHIGGPVGFFWVQVDWGIIKLVGAGSVQISKAWFAPITVTRGNYINAFAEISDPSYKVAKVEVFSGTTYLFDLTDGDGDSTWSGQYMVPAAWTAGWKGTLKIVAKNATGAIIAKWPGIQVK